MPAKGLAPVLAAGLTLSAAVSLCAQSLGDVAKKEEERRKATPAADKVYTNKDLAAVPPSSVESSADKDAGQSGKTADKNDKNDKGDKNDKDGKAGDKSGGDKASDKADDKGAADKSGG